MYSTERKMKVWRGGVSKIVCTKTYNLRKTHTLCLDLSEKTNRRDVSAKFYCEKPDHSV